MVPPERGNRGGEGFDEVSFSEKLEDPEFHQSRPAGPLPLRNSRVRYEPSTQLIRPPSPNTHERPSAKVDDPESKATLPHEH